MSNFLTEVWTHHNEDAIFNEFEGVATGLWPDETGIDPNEFLKFFQALSPFLKNVRLDFVQWHESGDELWLRWWVRCQHWKKSEKLIALPCAASTRFREGKLVECNNFQDMLDLFGQLDLLPEQAFEYGLAGADLLESEERKKEALPPSAKGQTHFLWPGVRKVKSGGRELYLPCPSRQFLNLEQQEDFVLPDDEQLEVLFESAAFAMVVVDHQDVILEADGAFAELVDRIPASLPGLVFHQFVFPDDQAAERAFLVELLEGKRTHYRHRLRLMRGRTVLWAQVAVARVPSSQGGSRIVRAVQEGSRLEELVEFQETERKMLSMELHDGLAQELATLWIYLQTGKHQLEATPVLVERCLRVVENMSKDLRRRMKELRSPVLEGVPLTKALETLVARVSRDRGLDITIEHEPEVNLVDHTVSLLVYRVVQEAIRNVGSHAKASHCHVAIRRDGDMLQGSIVDDGCGFDQLQAALKGRLGIVGMRERCELVGGTLKLESQPGLGTSVFFELRAVRAVMD